MPTDILIKRSTTASSVPTTSDLSTGELAVNTADKRLYTNNSGTIVELGTYPSTLNVTGNTDLDGTLNVDGASTLASGTVSGNWTVTGTLTVGTPSNSTDAASKGYVDTAVANVIDAAPGALDTLNELAAALNDDANFYTTITNSIATKLALAGGTMTGDITLGANKITSTATPATDDTLTRKGYVDGILGSATDAATSATAAATSATAAANSATSAASSATTATTQASAASTSATNASTSETNAATSASSASTSASAASTSATAAATSATNAETAYDNFDDRYLGDKSSAPTLDNDGDALVTGALYFDTTQGGMYVYTGSAWEAAYSGASGLLAASNNLSDVADAATSRTNLGLGTAATTASTDYATAAQGTLADSALQSSDIGSTVQGYDATIVVDADIGSTVQAYDADTAKLDVTQNYTAPQRSADTVDNDGSFDLSAAQNFTCTPTGNITLTFTNIPDGQSGTIVLVNTGGHTISAHTNTKVMGADMLTTITTAGTYVLGYISDSSVVRVYNSGAQQ